MMNNQQSNYSAAAARRLLIIWTLVTIAGAMINAAITVLLTMFLQLGVTGFFLMLGAWPIYAAHAIVLAATFRGLSGARLFALSVGVAFALNLLTQLLMIVVTGSFGAEPLLVNVVFGALVGGAVGLVQSFILASYVRSSELWVAAYALGSVLMGGLQTLLGPVETIEEWILLRGPLVGLLMGLTTGLTLLWLLRPATAPQNPGQRATPAPRATPRPASATPRPRPKAAPLWLQGLIALFGIALLVLTFAFFNPGRAPAAGVSRTPIVSRTPLPGDLEGLLEGWFSYKSAEGRYEVLMPGEPSLTSRELDTGSGMITQYIATASSSRAGYSVLYADNAQPINADNVDDWLDSVRDGSVESLNARIVSERPVTGLGYPAREIQLEQPGGTISRTWIVIAGQRIYQATTFTGDTLAADDEIDLFLNSFNVQAP